MTMNDKTREKLGQQLISTREFNQLLKNCYKQDKEYFKTNEISKFTPMLRMYGLPDSDNVRKPNLVVLSDFNSENKQQLLIETGIRFAKEKIQIVVVFMTSEMWSSSVEHEGKLKYSSPSEDPNRQEGFITVGRTLDGRSNMSTNSIYRLGKNRIISLSEPGFFPYKKGKNNIDVILVDYFYMGYLIGTQEVMQNESKN